MTFNAVNCNQIGIATDTGAVMSSEINYAKMKLYSI